MTNSKAQIIATIGPSSDAKEVFKEMLDHGLDIVRLNFSWGDLESRKDTINLVREMEREYSKKIPIIVDLPGPRIQEEDGHTYDSKVKSAITPEDKNFIEFGALQGVDYIALSFVASKADIIECRDLIKNSGGKQKVIAKIEREIALENLEEIIQESDAVMVARGDLGNEIALERIPFVQDKIIHKTKELNKPVIVATQMLFSMTENSTPTRAEVTDVANAIMRGADAVMLSEETAIGKHPIAVIKIMHKIVLEAEHHMDGRAHFNHL